MNKKAKNHNKTRKEKYFDLSKKPAFQSGIKLKKIVDNSLIFGVLIAVLGLYFVHDPAFAQTGSSNRLIEGTGVSSDGSVHVTIQSTPIEQDKPLALQISFTDPGGNLIPYEHYGIRAQQVEGNGVLIISNYSALAVNGQDIQTSSALQNVSPINFQIQLQGAGSPDTSITEWKGPVEIVGIILGQEYAAHIAVSQAPSTSSQVVTIPFGAYDPNFNTAAPQWYQPAVVTIQVNQSVTWINQDKETHTITSGKSPGRASLIGNKEGQPNGLFDSGDIKVGESWTHEFTKPGTFEYFCTIHPWMQGYVIVQPKLPTPVDAEGNKITKFPIVKFTPDRRYELDLGWEPHYITTGQKIIFVFQFYDTIKDLAVPEPYTFTITQDGQQLYRVDDATQFGGGYQYFRFDKPGPVSFKFLDIAHTNQGIEYTTIVEPGNSTDMSNMDMPIVEPARNLELTWWLMPLLFAPTGGAVVAIYIIKHRAKREDTGYTALKTKSDKTSEKRTPI